MSKVNKIFLDLLIKSTLVHKTDIVDYVFSHFNNDLYEKSLNLIGINNVGDSYISGEHNLIAKILKNEIPRNALIFEVGANSGDDTKDLRTIFPEACIYSFEPNSKAFRKLNESVEGKKQHNFNIALGASRGVVTHYSYSDLRHTQLATSSKEVLTDMFIVKDKLNSYQVNMDSIDSFTKEKNIKHIDFLKIDVEGAERDVLEGAHAMIKNKHIDYIQFEFNLHNVVNRVFLRDFYQLLPGYSFYRVMPKGLLSLGQYHPKHEIFQYQNIFASRKKIEII